MAGRRCPGRDNGPDGKPKACPTILTRGQRYCRRHMKAYEQKRGSSTERGLGADHQRERARIQSDIDAGQRVCCWNCGARLIGTAWHLDHTVDRTAYRGPACITCNTSEGGARGARITNSQYP
jgi:hypothetical protein